jgi:Polyketide cyclase / dehydrase and lipid transport
LEGYRFLTTWLLDAPRDDVFRVVWDFEAWPSWWRGVESVVQLEPGDGDGVGSLGRYVWKSRLPYRLEFDMRTTRVERPRLMEGAAIGELTGIGRWRFFEDGSLTAVVYEWDVRTTRPWMNALAPLARPVFAWNHDVIMRWGGEGLARRLGAPLLAHG